MARLRQFNPGARVHEEGEKLIKGMKLGAQVDSYGRKIVCGVHSAVPSAPLSMMPVIAAAMGAFAGSLGESVKDAVATCPRNPVMIKLQQNWQSLSEFRLSTRTGTRHLLHEADLINEDNAVILRKHWWVGFFDELQGWGKTKTWALMANVTIKGVFVRMLLGTTDTSGDGTGLAQFNHFKTLADDRGLMKTNLHNLADGARSACAVTGPFSSCNARILKAFGIGSDWCITHCISLISIDGFINLHRFPIMESDCDTSKVTTAKAKLLQQLPLVKLQCTLYKFFQKNGPIFEELRKAIKDLPLEEALMAVGVSGCIKMLSKHHAVRWKSIYNCTSQKYLIMSHILTALDAALRKSRGKLRNKIAVARREMIRLRHQSALITDIEPIITKLMDNIGHGFTRHGGTLRSFCLSFFHHAWRYLPIQRIYMPIQRNHHHRSYLPIKRSHHQLQRLNIFTRTHVGMVSAPLQLRQLLHVAMGSMVLETISPNILETRSKRIMWTQFAQKSPTHESKHI